MDGSGRDNKFYCRETEDFIEMGTIIDVWPPDTLDVELHAAVSSWKI